VVNNMVRYLVTFGNGHTGKATITALRALGETDIVAGARDPVASEASLKAAGASQVVEFNFSKPETITSALQGVERVFQAHGRLEDEVGSTKLLTSAVLQPGSSVKVISRVTALIADPESPHLGVRTDGLCALALKETGLTWFTVGPTFFMENWLDRRLSAIKAGAVYGAAGEGRTSYIAVSDIGKVAAHALRNPEKYNGRHLGITGPSALTESECLQAISAATGLSAKYVSVPAPQLQEALMEKGVPPPMIDFIVMLEGLKNSGIVAPVSPVVREVTGCDPITFDQWALENAVRFK